MNKYPQRQYNKKWEDQNRDYSAYLKHRSRARSFLRDKATAEDLEEFEKIMQERKIFLEKSVDKF